MTIFCVCVCVCRLAHFFGCGVEYLPSSYLDLPLGAPYKRHAVWEPIVERFYERLVEWKSKMLSRGIGVHYCKAAHLVCLFTSCLYLPFHYHCQPIRENHGGIFHWSINDSKNGFHWVIWDDVHRSKHEGGLGITRLHDMRKLLRPNGFRGLLRRRILYGEEWCRPRSMLVHYRVKNGSKILVWHDVWCGDQLLKFQFLDLFRMVRLKEVTAHEVVSWNSNFILSKESKSPSYR